VGPFREDGAKGGVFEKREPRDALERELGRIDRGVLDFLKGGRGRPVLSPSDAGSEHEKARDDAERPPVHGLHHTPTTG